MKKFTVLLIVAFILAQVLAVSAGETAGTNEKAEKKIIVFKKDFTDKQLKDKLLDKYGAQKVKHLNLINAVAVKMTPHVQRLMEEDSMVLRVDEDVEVQALGKPTPKPTAPPAPSPSPSTAPNPTPTTSQDLPWGINKIDAEWVTIDDAAGSNIRVAVIDTGIDTAHPDLAGLVVGGVNTIGTIQTTNYIDDNGHGTHVAGIIAAKDNSFGVVGVSQRIALYSIKVLNKRGSGYISDIIEGLEWAVNNKIQVANMSLGASVDVDSFRTAAKAAHDAGVILVAAAGNESGKVSYPAAYDESVIAVAATDSYDKIAYFSNFGPEVDVAAPGVSILSTYKGSTYATMSGTSMASPHVAGVAALVLMANPTAAYKPDGTPNPDWVMAKIKGTAFVVSNDVNAYLYYGAGRVDAYKAVYGKSYKAP